MLIFIFPFYRKLKRAGRAGPKRQSFFKIDSEITISKSRRAAGAFLIFKELKITIKPVIGQSTTTFSCFEIT